MTELHRNAATIQERLRDVGLEVEPRQLDTSARTEILALIDAIPGADVVAM
ncbi:MAG TPA: hypothetical protein VIY10_13840 [Solirubrobacteraceae bacterium]